MQQTTMSSVTRKRKIILSSSSKTLPDDIILCILELLPPKSLIRFMCVSKSWYSSITNPNFIKSWSVSSKRHSVFGMEPSPPRFLLVSPDSGTDDPPKLELPFEGKKRWRMVGSVNGLVCLVFDDGLICLCNPCIRTHVTILTPTPLANIVSSYYGLGFDPLRNDYHVVIIRIKDKTKNMIYSMNSGSWKNIRQQQDVCLDGGCSNSVCLNGIIYWVVGYGKTRKMMLFDVRQELFETKNLPNCEEDVRYDFHIPSLHVVKESIHLLCCRSRSSHLFQHWIMKEDCNSWIRQRDIVLEPLGGTQVWALSPNGEILVARYFGCPGSLKTDFYKYDLKEGQYSEMGTISSHNMGLWTSITDSLALLDRRHRILFPADQLT